MLLQALRDSPLWPALGPWVPALGSADHTQGTGANVPALINGACGLSPVD